MVTGKDLSYFKCYPEISLATKVYTLLCNIDKICYFPQNTTLLGLRKIMRYFVEQKHDEVFRPIYVLFQLLPLSCNTMFKLKHYGFVPDACELVSNGTAHLLDVPLAFLGGEDPSIYYSNPVSDTQMKVYLGPGSQQTTLDPLLLLRPFMPFTWIAFGISVLLLRVLERTHRFPVPLIWIMAQCLEFVTIMYPSNLRALVTKADVPKNLFNYTFEGLTQAVLNGEMHIAPETINRKDWFFINMSTNPDTFALFTQGLRKQLKISRVAKGPAISRYICDTFTSSPGFFLLITHEKAVEIWRTKNCSRGFLQSKIVDIGIPAGPNVFYFSKDEIGKTLVDFTSIASEIIRGQVDITRIKDEKSRRLEKRSLLKLQQEDVIFWRHLVPIGIVLEFGLSLSLIAFSFEIIFFKK